MAILAPRRLGLASLLAAVALDAAAQTPPVPDAGAPTTLPTTEVVGRTPLTGSGVDRATVPASVQVVTPQDLARSGRPSAARLLEERTAGVAIDDALANPYQPNLLYRGFEASPLAGNPQGLAVYMNGIRLNQSFGDTVNWDLVPDVAIDRMELQGANPVFGLNALGGALSVRTKDGFTYQGGEVETMGGSFGRLQGSAQYGRQVGPYALYVAASGLREDGWRKHSPSDLRQAFVDLGGRSDRADVHATLIGADNSLTGNGPAPTALLARDRSAVFTYPDETRNRYGLLGLRGAYALSDAWSLQGNAYGGNLSQRTVNGDASNTEPCDSNRTVVCVQDGPVLTDRSGNPIPNFDTGSPFAAIVRAFRRGGPYAQLNQTATDTTSYGASAQATRSGAWLGLPSQLAVGASVDRGDTGFSATSSLVALGLDRGVGASGIVIDQADGSLAPVRAAISNAYYGLFATGSLDLTPALTATLSGRLNLARIVLRDRLGTALNGGHSYSRFNPGVGLAYKLLPALSVYAGYSEANRAPTPAELSCANPSSPCTLTNFFVSDPGLKQVVARTAEAGLRGRHRIDGDGQLTWSAGLFRTDSQDDIQFTSSSIPGTGFFRNVGTTRRQGLEAAASLRRGALTAYAGYAYTDATFRSGFTEDSPNNPAADANGQIRVRPGDHLPGIPAHSVKLGATYDVTEAWSVGLSGVANSGRYLRGDEANLTPKTGAYVVLDFNTTYRLTEAIELFGLVQNLLDARYETFGAFSPTSLVPIVGLTGTPATRSVSPGPPIGGFAGARVRF